MTDVGTTRRRTMTEARRLKAWEAYKGVCVLCKQPIDGVRDKWIVEHMRALGLGGPDTDDNCGPAHEACRRIKDKDDVSRIAAAKRAKIKHLGIKTAPKRPIPSRVEPISQHKAKRMQLDKLPVPAPRQIYVERNP